jgi:hypothetical protein
MHNFFNIDIGQPLGDGDENPKEYKLPAKEKVKLSYIKTLPLFGTLGWYRKGGAWTPGAKSIFTIGNACRQDAIDWAIEQKEALIVETIGCEDEKVIFHIIPVHVLIDEVEDVSWKKVKVFYECGCGKKEVKVISANHLNAIKRSQAWCRDCGCMVDFQLEE